MKKVTIKKIEKSNKSRFLRVQDVLYKRDGFSEAKWEIIEAINTVHILVKNIDTNMLLLVKQVRIPVLVNSTLVPNGITLEACAGIVDKYNEFNNVYRNLHVAKDEIKEELGYNVNIEDIKEVDTLVSSVGLSGSQQTLYYCEVRDTDFTGQKLDFDEDIEVVSISSTKDSILDILKNTSNTDTTTKYLLSWYLLNK